jgi:mRNA interferase RelE/StbE
MFQIYLSKKVLSVLERLTAGERDRILHKMQIVLTSNPYPHGNNPLKLTGVVGYRLRIGDYRALYTVEGRAVRVYLLAHRREVYR